MAMIVKDIWRSQPGNYFCIATKRGDSAPKHKFFARNELRDIEVFIEAQRGVDVYFAPNGFSERSRGNEHAMRGVWLYADLDAVNPLKIEPEPTIAIKTSPGRHQAFWRCDRTVSDDLAKALVYLVKADRDSHARNKILRVPGTTNYKEEYDEPRVRVMWSDGPDYRVSELERFLPRVKERKRKAATGEWPVPVVRVKASASVKELMRQFGVKNIYMGPAGDRSKAIYAIRSPMVERGASLPQIMRVLEASWAWQSKLADRDGWCDREIERICEKLEK